MLKLVVQVARASLCQNESASTNPANPNHPTKYNNQFEKEVEVGARFHAEITSALLP